MNVTMQIEGEYLVLPTRDVLPTTLDMSVSGDGVERITVTLLAGQIVGDLVTQLFHEKFCALVNGDVSKALENTVRAYLFDKGNHSED